MRVSNVFTLAPHVLVGVTLAGTPFMPRDLWAVALAMMLVYSAGMILNDVCDYETDCRDRPERPLPAGRMGRWAALGWAGLFTLMAFGLLAWRFAWRTPETLAWAGILVGCIIIYNCRHRDHPLSILLMAACRTLVYVVSFAAAGGFSFAALALPAWAVFFYVSGLTWLARHETGTAPPHAPLVLLAAPAALPFLIGLMPRENPEPSLQWGVVLPALLVFCAWTLYAIQPAYRRNDPVVGPAVGRLIAGLSTVDLVILATLIRPNRPWTPDQVVALFFCLMVLALTTLLQRHIKAY